MTRVTLTTEIFAHGEAALKGLNALPGNDKKKLAEIMQQLLQMRDGLIAQRCAGANYDHWLRQANAVVSSLFGTEFPLSGFNKMRIEETRTALEKLLDDALSAPSASDQ